MEELNKKVIWNAVSAYMMVLVSVTFLFSKKKYLNHPFVRSHVRSAFILHVSLFIIWFIMSYDFFSSITILAYSLNSIITAILFLCVFAAILYGMRKAHLWQSVTMWEIFHTASWSKKYITKNTSENIQEHDAIKMILAHVPFLGYVVGTRNIHLTHMRDILQLNLIVTLCATLLLIFGYSSLANIVMLVYIIWSVMQSISLVMNWNVASIWIDILPTVEEKYILQKTIIRYILNTLNKNIFVPFSEIKQQKIQERKDDLIASEKSMKSPYSFIIKNSIVLLALFIWCMMVFGIDSPVLILFLFPVSYLFWYSEQKVYKMPYIYDIYDLVSRILWKIWHIFSQAKKLKNTTKTESIKLWDTPVEVKKES